MSFIHCDTESHTKSTGMITYVDICTTRVLNIAWLKPWGWSPWYSPVINTIFPLKSSIVKRNKVNCTQSLQLLVYMERSRQGLVSASVQSSIFGWISLSDVTAGSNLVDFVLFSTRMLHVLSITSAYIFI